MLLSKVMRNAPRYCNTQPWQPDAKRTVDIQSLLKLGKAAAKSRPKSTGSSCSTASSKQDDSKVSSKHARSLFGLPVNYHSPESRPDTIQLLLQLEHSGLESLEEHPLAGWLYNGALYTRPRAFSMALHHGWAQHTRGGEVQWQSWEVVRSHTRRLTTSHVQVAKDALTERLNYTCYSIEPGLLRQFKSGLLTTVAKQLVRYTPASAISLLHIFLNGLPASQHLHHEFLRGLLHLWRLSRNPARSNLAGARLFQGGATERSGLALVATLWERCCYHSHAGLSQ
eukprot:51755-Amphidinium_carterae.1